MKYSELANNIIGIYKIDFPNNKVYIGLSKDIRRRIREHFWGSKQFAVDKALHKYYNNINDFNISILEQIDKEDYKLLSQLEIKWIKYYHSNEKEYGYNLTTGGLPSLSTTSLPWSHFTLDDILIIYQRLLENEGNQTIANDYHTTPETIGQINQGHRYKQEGYDYPIRNNNIRLASTGLNNHNTPSLELIQEAYLQLCANNKTYDEIANYLGVSFGWICNFNNGKLSYSNQLPYTYPISKQTKNNRRHPLTATEVDNIKKLLKENQLTQKEIAEFYQCNYNTIGKINSGKTYYDSNENYPLRKGYPHSK